MAMTTETDQSDGAAERKAQSDLTARLGAPLVRRSKVSNFKWSTWTARFGGAGKKQA